MKILKKIMLATLGFGTLTMGALVAVPTEAQAGIFKKLAQLFRDIADVLEDLDELFFGMKAGDSGEGDIVVNMQEAKMNGDQYGVHVSADGRTITFDQNTDLYENEKDRSKKLQVARGTYAVNGEGRTHVRILCVPYDQK